MTQWLKNGTRRVCLFMRHACLTGMLAAALAGCNGGDEKQEAQGTFPESTVVIKADDTKVPDEPVVGVITKVPDTDPTPQNLEPPSDPLARDECDTSKPWFGLEPWSQQSLDLLKRCGKDIAMPNTAARFLATAPDTIEGAAFESSATFQYDLGNLVARFSTDAASFTGGRTFVSPTQGWIRYPEKTRGASSREPERYPVIIFLHGQHPDNATEHSYQGYNYLAENLTPHGYVVLSIDARVINESRDDNYSSLPRAQLVLGTLDRLRQINENGQVDKDGKPGPLNVLKGKLDFGRIGLMGIRVRLERDPVQSVPERRRPAGSASGADGVARQFQYILS